MRLFKKIAMTIAALWCCLAVSAHDFEVDGIYYNITSRTSVEVTFRGTYNDSYSNEYVGKIVIPERVTYNDVSYIVTSIGYDAFQDCSGLTSITLPNSLTSIGVWAFYGCTGLTSLTLPNSLTSIGSYAFRGCSGLTSLTLPNSLTSIGSYAFYNCSGLTSLTLPDSLTSIGESTFDGCSGLTSITLPNSVTSIGESAFDGCSNLTSIVLPNSLTSIGDYAFYNCSSLTSIALPNFLTSIGKYAFYGCRGLTSIILSNSLTSIGSYAFYGCSNLTSLTLPDSLTSIGYDAFYGCKNLKTVINLSNLSLNKGTTSNGCVAYYADKVINADEQIGDFFFKTSDNIHYLIDYVGTETEIELPKNYKGENYEIGNKLFYNCTNITNVTIPNSVTNIGASAFYNCSGLTSIALPNSLTSIGEKTFYGCSGLTSLTLPNSVTSIGEQAFYGCENLKILVNLSNLSLSKGKTSNGYVAYYANKIIEADEQIGDFFFKTSDNIHYLVDYIGTETEIQLPENYKGENYEIGTKLFYECTNITNVTIPNSVTSIGESAFDGCSNLTSIVLPNSLTSIGDYAFYSCTRLKSITLPNSLTSIGKSAFYGCRGLTSIILPNSLTSIGNYAFYNCSGLTSLTLPNSLTSIGEQAFRGCSGLTNLTLPNSLTSIGKYAFYGCRGLTSIILSNSLTSIGSYAFYGCSNLTSLTLPDSLTSIGSYAFYNCSGLTSLTLSNSLTSIDSYAFSGCSGLTSILLPNSLTYIGEQAFYDCSNLKTVINFSNRNVSKGSSLDGYVAYYADKVINADEQIGDFFFKTTDNIHYLIDYVGTKTEIELPKNYKGENYEIETKLFYNCTNITNVTIPNSVTSIGEQAFSGCSGLTNLTLPNSVTSIGDYAFSGCSGLTSLTLSNSLTSIGEQAFSGCSGLTSLTLPNSLTSIGSYAFSGCSNLEEVHISSLAAWCNISFQELTSNPLYYANKLFIDGKLTTELTIPEGVTIITSNAFCNCSSLTSVNIPESVTSIGNLAFYGCSGLTSLILPNSLTRIGDRAFGGCENLKTVINYSDLWLNKGSELDGGVAYYADKVINADEQIGDFFFMTVENIHYLTGYLGTETDIKLPENYKGENYAIGNKLFYNCTNITNVTIPNSVTSIGYDAFYGCENLKTVINFSNLSLSKGSEFDGYVAYYADKVINADEQIEEFFFKTSDNIHYLTGYLGTETDIKLPENYKGENYAIGNKLFYNCTNITNVTIPNSVTSICESAFCNCIFLTSIVLPNALHRIEDNAFNGCKGLTSIIIPNTVTHIGKDAFKGCENLSDITLSNSVTRIGDSAFADTKWWDNQALGFVYLDNCLLGFKHNGTIPDNVELALNVTEGTRVIADNAFKNFNIITNVMIPNSLTHIGKYAFSNCNKLGNILIGESLEWIGEGAFLNCKGLSTVRVADIGTWYNIEFESREANPLYYARHLYKNTDEITDLEIPYSVNNYAFINCENLTSITLGANVSSLGEGAFKGCTNVTQIISNSPVPPICGIDALTDINKWNCTLKVVKGCKSAYQAADQWKEFFFIEDVVEIVYYALKFVVDGEVYHIDSLEFNEPIVFPEAPVKEGYTFSGWSEAPETMPAHDVTVTGSFEVDGIETIITSNLVDVYTLQGVIVKSRIPVETLREELSTGIYIVNGKKFVVK